MIAAGGEHLLGVELRFRPDAAIARRPAGRCSGRARRRADCDTARTIRRVIAAASIDSFECTLATTTSRRSSSSGSWSRLPSSRMSTSMPVRMRIGANRSRSPSMTSSCLRSRSGDSPLAIVSRGEWSVSAQYSWPSAAARGHHLLDRRRAVRPVRMQMQIAAQRGADLAATEILCGRTQFDQHVGLAAGPGLGDHLRGLRADAGQRLPAVGLAVPLALGVVEGLDDVGGVAVGHHPAGVLARAVLVVGDLTQRGYRIHASSVPPGRTGDDEPAAARRSRRSHRRSAPSSPPRCPAIGVFELVVGVLRRTPWSM